MPFSARSLPLMSGTQPLDNAVLDAVLDTVLDAVAVTRLDGTIAGWNDIAETTFGWSFIEMRGRALGEAIMRGHSREMHEQVRRDLAAVTAAASRARLEIVAVHRDGRELPVDLVVTRTNAFGGPVLLHVLRDLSERQAALRRQELLVGELQHRIKNLLGVVAGIAHQTARTSGSLEVFSEAFNGRLASLARAHDVLTSSIWERAPFRALAEELLAPYLVDGRARVSGPTVTLSPRQLLSLTMILHELMTNAVKYGALHANGGTLSLEWALGDGVCAMTWTEIGVGPVAVPAHTGFGIRMIALSVTHELIGVSERIWTDDGLVFRLHFPVIA